MVMLVATCVGCPTVEVPATLVTSVTRVGGPVSGSPNVAPYQRYESSATRVGAYEITLPQNDPYAVSTAAFWVSVRALPAIPEATLTKCITFSKVSGWRPVLVHV